MSETKLLLLLQKKRGFFETILDLTERESQLPLDDWINVLEQKKILLACIEEIDEELDDFAQKMPHLPQDISDEMEETKQVIEKILHFDKVNLEKRKEHLSGKKKDLSSQFAFEGPFDDF